MATVKEAVPDLVARCAEPFDDLEQADLDPILDRIGEARVVCIGEASHGTSEFYRLRARITAALVERKGFRIVAAEADWPDAARIDRYVRHLEARREEWTAFARFPTWMWRNEEVAGFVDWLRAYNEGRPREERAGFHGVDLYSLYGSIGAVLDHLDALDPEAAAVARDRYGCLAPFDPNPAAYGRMAVTGRYTSCEADVVAMLQDLLQRRTDGLREDPEAFFDVTQNARLIANAERYYRVMYQGAVSSWNLRDSHMFETLRHLLAWRGDGSRAVVWAHNSHLGDARYTEMGARGEHNVGQLCRQAFGDAAYLIGFGTDRGTVAAASSWDAPMEVKQVRPSHERSYERVGHDTGIRNFFLPLRHPNDPDLRGALGRPRLERAIGVIYRPQTELQSHYFQAILPDQFDEWIWMDETEAVTPLPVEPTEPMPDTWPFGL